MFKLEMEDEYHFCMPRLPEKKKKRNVLFNNLKNVASEKFMFLMNPTNQRPETQKLKVTQVFKCFRIRNEQEDKK